jgi:hypothetical protein
MQQSNYHVTTQLLDLKTKISNLAINKAPLKQNKNVPTSGKHRYAFELWHLEKLTTNLSITWASAMTKPGIGVTNIPTMAKMVLPQRECMLPTNQISMIDGSKGGPKLIGVPQMLLRLMVNPNQPLLSLMTLLPQNFLLPSLFKQH